MKEKAGHLIAIVDDDESVREATTSLLKSSGFRAETFSSAEEFLRSPLVEKTKCLLLDVGMPGMNGLELQRQLAAEGRRIPIIGAAAGARAACCLKPLSRLREREGPVATAMEG